MKLTDTRIKQAKQEILRDKWYSLPIQDPHHEHNDCIRIAYEWIDAQTKTKHPQETVWKPHIEYWGKRYVSASDIDVAAYMHPDIKLKKVHPRDGSSPYILLNISKRIIVPSINRLKNIGESFKHPDYDKKMDFSKYKNEDESS